MKCPQCDKYIANDWLDEEGIEANEVFECWNCEVELTYTIDEGTYLGATHTTVEIV